MPDKVVPIEHHGVVAASRPEGLVLRCVEPTCPCTDRLVWQSRPFTLNWLHSELREHREQAGVFGGAGVAEARELPDLDGPWELFTHYAKWARIDGARASDDGTIEVDVPGMTLNLRPDQRVKVRRPPAHPV